MTKRQQIICAHLPCVEVLADVGCDHGYIAEYAIKQGKCKRVILTDISSESLKKAENLLQKEREAGLVFSYCCDGMSALTTLPDCAVIAGMGGQEIVKILQKSGIPQRFVLQPMKNSDTVRRFLVERGCRLIRDFTFEDGKAYDLIVGEREGGCAYSEREFLFGRDNLKEKPLAFLNVAKDEIEKLKSRLQNPALSKSSKASLQARLREWEEAICN